MGKLLRFSLVVVVIAATSGCQLCLLPCYVCLATPQSLEAEGPLPEIAPIIAATDGDEGQLPAR